MKITHEFPVKSQTSCWKSLEKPCPGASEAVLFGALDGLREDVRKTFKAVHQWFARLKRREPTFPQWKMGRHPHVLCRFFPWLLDTFRVWCWWNSSKLPWHWLDIPIQITISTSKVIHKRMTSLPGLRTVAASTTPSWMFLGRATIDWENYYFFQDDINLSLNMT